MIGPGIFQLSSLAVFGCARSRHQGRRSRREAGNRFDLCNRGDSRFPVRCVFHVNPSTTRSRDVVRGPIEARTEKQTTARLDLAVHMLKRAVTWAAQLQLTGH